MGRPRHHRAQADGSKELPRGSESVLVVEDEPMVREMMRRYLGGLGYRVMEASNGSEAFRLLQETGSHIDVLLTDVVMPEMGGLELARKVRELQPQVKILFVSGYSADEKTLQEIGGPSATFVSKPFNAATLASALRNLLDR